MEWFTKCCLLVILAVCFGSSFVLGDGRNLQGYNGDLYNGEFENEEGTEALRNIIGQIIDDVDAKNNIRTAILEDTLEHAQYEPDKRSGRCRSGTKCIMRGPNPNTASRVLPFGKREDDSPNKLARRGRGPPKNSRARGGRTLLPFGKRR
ncbi:uncharacterized protein LOC117305096 [Asterias rubens]|uniref:Kisspeptin-type n=1 Tax=Asterias rubens TaxID=7604 RepID=A0A0U2PTB8_ASTRU|nr:uncharacterized protein LOC117305096 [Asterias rubens]ALJ99947.1 kisspeptin-type precursor [Asterias rubens]